MKLKVMVANESHVDYAQLICDTIADAAAKRGTGIARRSPDYVAQKMRDGKAVIALEGTKFAGFCYLETWSHNKFVVHSGLIVVEDYRKSGLATQIKTEMLKLSRRKYPEAKIFGITTSLAVMKINSDLGYRPVTFSELTQDEDFWSGCQSCRNYDILTRNNRRMCLCTGMLYDPAEKKNENFNFEGKVSILERLNQIKQNLFLKGKNNNGNGNKE